MSGTVHDPGAVLAQQAGDTATRRVIAGLVLPAITVTVAVIGLRVPVPGGLSVIQAAAFILVLCWASMAVVLARAREWTPQWQLAFGSLAASLALAAARVGDETGGQHQAARAVATLAALLVIAVFFHMMLGLPDGRLLGTVRRVAVGLAYATGIAVGLVLALAHQPVPAGAAALAWSLAVLCAIPAVRLRYRRSGGRDRERMQWMAVGIVLAADAALVMGVLHLLVGWPGPVAGVMAGCVLFVLLGMIAASVRELGPSCGRVLVQVVSVAGFTVVVAVIYLVVVLGIGTVPHTSSDREILGLSMLAAAAAAIGYLPARDWLVPYATRLVYGAREAPDETVRTFGSRVLTRAIPMDELLLQLAESLRKTMALTRAEVYTGKGDVLERAVSVPDAGPGSIVVTARERPVVARAGVSGGAWASVWLPALLDGREQAQLRVAPVSHAGELLGLIVVVRPATANSFSDDDDRVLTDLARQVGLAFHNAQLDAELQITLDQLRAQAQALRESRARIVASGDAERRRLERDLHDGAQQNLVALAVNLRLAKDLLAGDPAAGAEMLDQMADEVKQAIQDLRELAHGIYPPLLAGCGLGEALRAAAGRSPLAVAVTSDGIGRYAPEIEAAVYFCCLEALQNAAKHAPGAHVRVRVWEQAGGLLFSVTDDGPGFDAEQAQRGHGLVNMADRLGAIGGSVRWESEPGKGAQVRASIPLL